MNRRIILLTISFLLSNYLNAATKKLSINDAVKMAFENHEEIKKAKIGVEKLENQYREALSYALPKVTAAVNWNTYLKSPVLSADLGTPIGTIVVPLKQPYELDMNATLTQPVWTFGKVSTALDIADNAREAQRYSYAVTKSEIKYQTKYLYNSVLFAQKILEIAKNSLKNAENNKKQIQGKFNYGRISRYDNVKMSADIAARVPAVLNAESNLDLTLRNFKLIIGIEENQQIELTNTLSEKFSSYSIEKLQNDLSLNEPLIKALKANIELYTNIAKLKKADYYPSIGFFTQYQYSGNSNHAFVGTNHMYHMLVLGFSITGTLWDSGATSSRYKQAINNSEIAELNLIQNKKKLNAELQSALAEYNSAIEIYKANLGALKLANKSYSISLSSFGSGQITQIQLNDAELMLTNAKMGTDQTLYKINNLIAKIERLTTGEN